jgi:hypothetical protein
VHTVHTVTQRRTINFHRPQHDCGRHRRIVGAHTR